MVFRATTGSRIATRSTPPVLRNFVVLDDLVVVDANVERCMAVLMTEEMKTNSSLTFSLAFRVSPVPRSYSLTELSEIAI